MVESRPGGQSARLLETLQSDDDIIKLQGIAPKNSRLARGGIGLTLCHP